MRDVFFMIVIRIKGLLSRSDSCIDRDWCCGYEQAAIEGE